MQETWVPSLGQEVAWSQKWQPTPVFLPGKFQEQRSLVGCSPWGHKELVAHTPVHKAITWLTLH